MSSVEKKMMGKEKCEIYLDDQKLVLVTGQRGKELLLLNGYTFSRNLVAGNSIYWCCRHRTVNEPPCRARARSQQKDNGLFTIVISQPVHNHRPTFRSTHRMMIDHTATAAADDDYDDDE